MYHVMQGCIICDPPSEKRVQQRLLLASVHGRRIINAYIKKLADSEHLNIIRVHGEKYPAANT